MLGWNLLTVSDPVLLQVTSHLFGLIDHGPDQVFDVVGLVPLEVDLGLRRPEPRRGFRPAQLQHRRLVVGHHGEVSPGGELRHGVRVPVVPVVAAVRVGGLADRMLADVADLQRGEEAELPLLGQDSPVLLLSELQQRVRGQPGRLVVAQLQLGALPPRVLHLLQPGGELPQRLPAAGGRPEALGADHGAAGVGHYRPGPGTSRC